MVPTYLALHDLAFERQRDLLQEAARRRLARRARRPHRYSRERPSFRHGLAAALYALAALLDDRRPEPQLQIQW